MLGASDVQRMLGISPATYYRWLREGRLPGVQVGRRWRFRRSDVEALLTRGVDDGEGSGADEIEAAVAVLQKAMRDLGWQDDALARVAAEVAAVGGDAADLLARLVIEHAIAANASDVHLDVVDAGLVILERHGGIRRPIAPPFRRVQKALMRALKVMADLDPNEQARPQSGRFFHVVNGRQIDLRVSTYPGETLTLRMMRPEASSLTLLDLGFPETTSETLRSLVKDRTPLHGGAVGLVLVSGGTGSGKSTTLYSLVREAYTQEKKVMTAESGIGVRLDGVMQAPVSPRFTFEDAMQAMMENDLDVGMVSELLTPEAINFAFYMARTGHLVLAGLHAQDAPSALLALLTAGVTGSLVAENLRAILWQRLVRGSCRTCQASRKATASEADALGMPLSSRVYENKGCNSCGGTGVGDRVAISELLTVTPELASALNATPIDRDRVVQAAALQPRMRVDLAAKAVAGVISIDSALAALGTGASQTPAVIPPSTTNSEPVE